MTASGRPFNLSDRQVEILALVADGLSNAEIGKRLWIQPVTAKTHMHRIGQLMGCGDRAGMVALGFRTGLLRIPDAVVLAQAEVIRLRHRDQRLMAMHAELARQDAVRGAA